MKNLRYLAALLLLLHLTGCSHEEKAPIINAQLPVTSFTINTNRDTIITTPGGARLQIPAHAFSIDADTVQLSLQEAYTIQDMIKGGLTTMSGRQPLSSGGMINVMVNGANATFAKPIKVSIPTQRKVPGMQLFTGVAGADGTIDWQNPQPITNNEQIATGKAIFERECASCHHQTEERTGPPLAYIGQRRNAKWLYSFIRNADSMIRVFDPVAQSYHVGYAPYLAALYPDKKMPAFHHLNEEQLDALITYLNEPIEAMPVDYKEGYDSCIRLLGEMKRLGRIWEKLAQDNGAETIVTENENPGGPENGPGTKPADMLFPETRTAEYYTFSIQTQGWYNVDIFLNNVPGFVNSNLTVLTDGLYTDNAQIFFLLPEQRIFARGAKLPGTDNAWGFFKDNGDIALPQGAQAYIYLIGTSGEQISFASATFITQTRLQLQLTAIASNRVTVDSALNAPGFTGFSASVDESKNALELKAVETAIRRIDTLLYLQKCDHIIFPDVYTTEDMLHR